MDAVIFGGAGFVGRHLYERLKKKNAGTIRLVDIVKPEFPHAPEDFVFADVRETIPAIDVPYGCDVYNFAAVHRTPGHLPHQYYDTNVRGALNVSEFAMRQETKRFVFTSSISVYGPGEAEKSESTVPEPVSDYGRSKLIAEKIHRQWLERTADGKLIIVRPAVIFGAHENGNFTRLYHALRHHAFVYPGRKDTIKSCGYVEELLDTFEFALAQKEACFLYNFCYPERLTLENICATFQKVLNTPGPLGALPFSVLRSAAYFGLLLSSLGIDTPVHPERIDKLVNSTNISPAVLVSSGYQFRTRLDSALLAWFSATSGRMD